MIYVLRSVPDVYSEPFLRNQETKAALEGQQGLWVRGHICVSYKADFCVSGDPA